MIYTQSILYQTKLVKKKSFFLEIDYLVLARMQLYRLFL